MSEPLAPGLSAPALVVLVGPSGAGKSTWAARHYRRSEVLSSDELRGLVGTGPHDLEATTAAFAVLDQILRARLARRLTTVVDTLGLDQARRLGFLALARQAGLPTAIVVFRTPAPLCRSRNAGRDRPVPATALTGQLRRLTAAVAEIEAEGWDDRLVLTEESPPPSPSAAPTAAVEAPAPELGFVLQLSRFPWGTDPAGWVGAMARAAADAGFTGIALMDHLIQIPQVGRAWDPIPEPWVTLGLIAGLDLGLRLGTLVSPVTFRPAGVIAKAAATLDVLSGGRGFCGLGAGWWAREHAGFGLPFPPVRERLDQLEATIETIRALTAAGTKEFRGERVTLPETTSYPRPTGPLPIIVGGSGERRTLAIAARLADGCNLPSDPEVLAHKIQILQGHCARLGREPREVEITVLDLPVLGADREAVAAAVEAVRGRSAADVVARRAGTPADQIVRYRRLTELGVRTVFVSPAQLAGPDDLAPFAAITAAFRA